MTDLNFPATRSAVASALEVSGTIVGRRIEALKSHHNIEAIIADDKITRYGFERIAEYGDLGKREYERRYPCRDEDDGAGQLATISEASPAPSGGKLGLMPDTSDLDPDFAPATQRHSRYRDIAEANNAATSKRFANLAQANRQLIEGAMEEGRALGQMLSAAQQQAMLSEYQRQQDAFQKRFGSLGDEIAEGE
jgi:hypothetical protein